jgi:integrase
MPVDGKSPYFFPAERGDNFYLGTKRIWPEAIKLAGLLGVTPHTLRHTLGSTAVSSGESLKMTGATHVQWATFVAEKSPRGSIEIISDK